MPKIIVHEKALAHLSRGLYRSPASALRELVSNAWDANARTVRIDTNYPNFHLLSVEDDGDGFILEDFQKLMAGGIGNSGKRVENNALINNRPTIGRLGIGMLGIAQICGAFTLISKTRDGIGFKASVKLYDLLKDDLDEKIVDTEVDIGIYEIDESFDPKDANFGTSIIANEIHPTFTRSFQKSLTYEGYEEPPIGNWEEILRIVSRTWSLQELGDYWRLLWELSACCPVPYLQEDALPHNLVADEQKKLVSYDFKVFLDGIQLLKPVYLKDNPGGYTNFKIENEAKLYGKILKYHGYLVVQEGLQLKPDELRGILIRIKNIAIGYYDPSLLDYRYNEGPRSRWITGEIYVEEGLENALNVDRDSFNRFHPEFRSIQDYTHKILKEVIFPATYVKIKERSLQKESTKNLGRVKHLEDIISKTISKNVQVETGTSQKINLPAVTEQQPSSPVSEPRVEVISGKSSDMQVNLPPPESIIIKKAYRTLASAILSIFEIALREGTNEKKREIFTKLLIQLLKEW